MSPLIKTLRTKQKQEVSFITTSMYSLYIVHNKSGIHMSECNDCLVLVLFRHFSTRIKHISSEVYGYILIKLVITLIYYRNTYLSHLTLPLCTI